MYVSEEKIENAIKVFKKHGGILRTSEVLEEGIYRRTLYYMEEEGIVTKLERGVYKLAHTDMLSNPDLTIVAKKIPKAKVCLISALDFHEMTTQIPHEVHIALPRTSRDPTIEHPPIKVYRFSGESLTKGIEKHEVDGVMVRVYNPAKTIADCFKFRNKIGLDVAMEALQQGIKQDKTSYSDIIKYAKVCRVKTVIKPYLEGIAHG